MSWWHTLGEGASDTSDLDTRPSPANTRPSGAPSDRPHRTGFVLHNPSTSVTASPALRSMCSLARRLGSLQIRTRASAEMFDLGTEEGAVGGSLQAVDRPVSLSSLSVGRWNATGKAAERSSKETTGRWVLNLHYCPGFFSDSQLDTLVCKGSRQESRLCHSWETFGR